MKKEQRPKSFAYSIGTGIFAVFLFLLFYLAANKNAAPFMLILREVFPLYDGGPSSVIMLYAFGSEPEELPLEMLDEGVGEASPVFAEPQTKSGQNVQEEAEPEIGEERNDGIIGLDNVVYQPETEMGTNDNPQTELLTRADLSRFEDFDYLKSAMYTVDKRTALLPSDIDAGSFISRDFRLAEGDGPKVLIFHTHSQEGYSDSAPGDLSDGVFLVGDRLSQLLNDKYGIETLHDKSSYDIVNGVSGIIGAYERMEPNISRILEQYPSIELVIDLHRDGVADDLRFAADINGKPTAKLMFFNGLCRTYVNGEIAPTKGLSNPYTDDNLALSFNLQLLANEYFPGLTRKIYINAYRYSLHFKPKSLLVEVGAQTNTKEEALNAMEPLAELLCKLMLAETKSG